jgi:TolB-like protein/Flp pilus assembly protein TadD/tRNA A-37 threonylcarbamoyl transferase component Bud32
VDQEDLRAVTLRLGQTISHYKLLEHIGEGGMGVIFRAHDTRLNRQVAIKALHTHLTADAARRERFMREARAAGALNHPYIATVHEVDEVGSNIFIVMEFVDGKTLRSVIGKEPLAPARAARLGCEIAEGLGNAHVSGVVHRDLKPENIMIRPDNHPKLLDFGVAKVVQDSLAGLGEDPSDPLTMEGKILGTVGYMAPEQARGEAVDARADIFAFGVILYEMLTGEAPFKGTTGVETLSAILRDEPVPAPELNPEVSPAMQQILVRCLKKSPVERYQDTDELIHDLREAGGGTTISGTYAEVEGGVAYGKWGLILAAGLLAVAVAAVAWSRLTSTPDADPAPLSGPAASAAPAAAGAALDGRRKIVVLPFENLGPAEDAYFADGMTEEITSRLAVASALAVISRTSAFQYDREGKSMRQVGEDLGVDYVLEGTVRWAKGAGGASRVRITPQLIRVADDTHMWADAYDREIDDIFQVQADIAGTVIDQLGIVLQEPEREAMGSRPTENVESYQAFLRGLAHSRGPDAVTDEGSRNALESFRRAVELDPDFALAWAELSRSNSMRYHLGYDRTEARREEALDAIERASGLAPDAPEVRMSLGFYHYWAHKQYDKALSEFEEARRARPNNSDAYSAIGYVHRRQGRWEEAIQDFIQALELNPIDLNLTNELGSSLLFMRSYERAERYLDRSLGLDASQRTAYRFKALNALIGRGDAVSARKILEGNFPPSDPTIAWNWYQLLLIEGDHDGGLAWIGSLPAEILQDQTFYLPVPLLEAEALDLKGDRAGSRSAYLNARGIIEAALSEAPADHRMHSALGLTLAGLGEKEAAIREGREGIDLYPVAQDAYAAPERIADMARILIRLGDLEAALVEIDKLLSIPSLYSTTWIRIDPIMSPVTKHPGFMVLEARLGDSG